MEETGAVIFDNEEREGNRWWDCVGVSGHWFGGVSALVKVGEGRCSPVTLERMIAAGERKGGR